MGQCTEVFVGIDVSKIRNCVALAEGDRGGEVRYLREVDASEESMRRFVKRLAARYVRVQFCYEAGPTAAHNRSRPPLHRGRAFADPKEAWRPGQDEPT